LDLGIVVVKLITIELAHAAVGPYPIAFNARRHEEFGGFIPDLACEDTLC
jgi:hypothetical protein